MAPQQNTDTDPLRLLNFDCATLILDHLDLDDVGNAQVVSEAWEARVQEWAGTRGLQKLFPDAWKKHFAGTEDASKKGSNGYQLFRQQALEETCEKRWAKARALRAHEYIIDKKIADVVMAGEYLAWRQERTQWVDKQEAGVFWTRLGAPAQQLDMPVALARGLVHMKLHCSGLLSVYSQRVVTRDNRITQHVYDLTTSTELWRRTITGANTPHAQTQVYPIAIGWARVYHYGATLTELEAYDLRSGALLYTVPLFTKPVLIPAHSQVWRLGGLDVLVGISKTAGNAANGNPRAEMHFINTDTGYSLQTLRFDYSGGPDDLRIKVSTRRNELAFALVGGMVHGCFSTQIFEYEAARQEFVQRSLEDLRRPTPLEVSWRGWCTDDVTVWDAFHRFTLRVDRGLCPWGFLVPFNTDSCAYPSLKVDPPAVVVGKGNTRPYSVKDKGFDVLLRAEIGKARLFLYNGDSEQRHEKHHSRLSILDFGYGGCTIMQAQDCLQRPDSGW
ncbi:uncharacterized protein DSM5745_00074 [Aspergillus mulundensis]|uniref:F-box domain-containing protein n=1 Tax=Aspergillus mulundensis TaxID=1810919 RepID=A0A3D8T2F9_9EURO|nr:hypothetical protein DSM5745_00074 [Aspergillus mulundensis]RDW92752.1 hypothetical protein DSM5745_00074 [Aspergillus mulundensis]